jgi:hypothetical protein
LVTIEGQIWMIGVVTENNADRKERMVRWRNENGFEENERRL